MLDQRRRSAITNPAHAASHHAARFSLAIGGPLYDLYRRARLLEPPIELLERRLAAVVAVAWLPLLVLSLIDGKAVAGVRVPFVMDFSVHARLLIALPLMVAAEPLVHRSLRLVVRQFVDRDLIAQNELARFEDIIDATVRMRNSRLVEAGLLILSTVLALSFRRDQWSIRPSLWYVDVDANGRSVLAPGGWWYTLVSLNLFRFVILRWYYRLAIWYRFLWRTSRLSLRLNPLHPDRAGGLGFLDHSVIALMPVFVAQAIAVASEIGGRVVQDGMIVSRFPPELVAIPIIFAAIAASPLAFFSPALIRAGFHGVIDYGTLSSRYVDEFRTRWMSRHATERPELLGTPDIQTLADVANAYQVANGFRLIPISPRLLLAFVGANALPFLPFLLSIVPLKELLARLVNVVL